MKRSSFSDFRLDADRAFVTLYDSIADCQPESRALHSFGRIERFEHPLAHFFFHSDTSIREAQTQSLSLTFTANREAAALRHRIDGVDDQVDEYLTQLRCVASNEQA